MLFNVCTIYFDQIRVFYKGVHGQHHGYMISNIGLMGGPTILH